MESYFSVRSENFLPLTNLRPNSVTGGARRGMFGHLPEGILSQQGYRGCLASLELADQAISPLAEAVVPSHHVVQGCQG